MLIYNKMINQNLTMRYRINNYNNLIIVLIAFQKAYMINTFRPFYMTN